MPHTHNRAPVVSILLPAYNSERYLAATLDSILNQTFRRFEVIIAIDGSTDRTLEIARAYARRDTRIKILELPHRGEVEARNAAFENANADSRYLMDHDSDDISLPSKLEKLVAYLDHHLEIAIAGCLAEYFDDHGNYRGHPMQEYEPLRIRQTFSRGNSMVNSATLIRREVFERIGKYRMLLDHADADDYDFFARALLAGFKLTNIQEVLHRIRLHPRSIGQTRRERDKLVIQSIRRAYLAGRPAVPFSYGLLRQTARRTFEVIFTMLKVAAIALGFPLLMFASSVHIDRGQTSSRIYPPSSSQNTPLKEASAHAMLAVIDRYLAAARRTRMLTPSLETEFLDFREKLAAVFRTNKSSGRGQRRDEH